MALCHAFVKIVRITEGFGLPEWPHGGGHVAQVYVFQRKSMALCHAFVKIVTITEGFGLPEWPYGGAMYPKRTFSKGKAWFCAPPGARILRIGRKMDHPGGAAFQSPLG